MLRVVAHKSAAAAHSYYAEGLKREDYYSEGQEVVGEWHGKAAAMLGLSGSVTPEAFAALVENRHPGTGEKLTPRTKADRRVGYDFTFNAPKSVSILHALTGDEEILKAFRSAVSETMLEIEAQVTTRVRRGGAQSERLTGNLVWAEFIHFTARPVDGIPDPHLHIHSFAQNLTFDNEESRWKAASWVEIKKEAPYSEAVFHSRLTQKLVALGYGIDRTRTGWEIAGIPRTLIHKFSRRTSQIEQLAESKGISDPKLKDMLGAASREGKRHGMTYSDLLAAWGARLTAEEKVLISKVHFDKEIGAVREKITPRHALDEASEKLFAKSSVVEVNRLVAEALRFGIGQVTPGKVWQEFERRGMVARQIDGRMLCTSLDVLAEEVALINFVRGGRGTRAPFKGRNAKIGSDTLSAEQNAAVRHILTSRDQAVGLRGAAGVGKTKLMREAVVSAIEECGFKVFVFAPSASMARETLRADGFANAETIAHLLLNTELQKKTRGQVIWVDEAALVGTHDMLEVMRIAGDSTAVILSGDTAQHAPVPRGDAFRQLQKYAGMKVVEVTEIRRQQRDDYRKAVSALSKGDLRTAFSRLDEMGAIVEIEDDVQRYAQLAQDFLALSRKGAVPLVVSPTHAENAKVTAAIREAKREAGKLGPERPFIQYHNLQWEDPDKRRAENYHAGLIVQFNQNARGIQRGDLFRITGVDGKGGVLMEGTRGRKASLPLNEAKRFQVFEEREINLARGDQIRITHGGKSVDGKRLNNGNVFTIEKFTSSGRIVLNTGAILDAKHGHLAHGVCSTSHASQGKTVRDVLVAQCTDSFFSSSKEQFYVSVSRGKESVRIYTDDRRGLQEAVGSTSTRKSAVELAGLTKRDLTSLMNGVNGSRQWRDMVQSRTEGDMKTHLQNLLRERKQEGKSGQMDFREYVKMKRALAGPDGKSRSKGYSGGNASKTSGVLNRGGPGLRQIQPRVPHKTVSNENKKQPTQVPPRQSRLAKGYAAAASRFKKVTERVKGAVKSATEKRVGQMPKTSVEQAAKHGVKQRVADAAVKAKAQTKIQQKQMTPPAPRRGR
jgi:conjugative relaxase-like TrwC/TraI family protein